ncbi:J domain-containing protein [Fundidesulfovibrio agrisoli]|uniref:J domain-containing protein n=1 Tax=Fundidesulfovibrio agrisoli TaxID=2922717 RepID=UPI001FAD1F03|nr:DnaJ domain-containing protein [Fundidesulfovibrio agrisoli]
MTSIFFYAVGILIFIYLFGFDQYTVAGLILGACIVHPPKFLLNILGFRKDYKRNRPSSTGESSKNSEHTKQKYESGQYDGHRRGEDNDENPGPDPDHLVEMKYIGLLGLGTYFSTEDIKKAYKQKISKYHPDKVEHLGDEFKLLAEEKAKELNNAYQYLLSKHAT